MSMLNTPAEVVENYRVVDEAQYIYWNSGLISSRRRKMTYTTYRYVGCELTAAQAKADALNADNSFRDINVTPAGGSQYHVVATKRVAGTWSTWELDSSAGDDPGEEE